MSEISSDLLPLSPYSLAKLNSLCCKVFILSRDKLDNRTLPDTYGQLSSFSGVLSMSFFIGVKGFMACNWRESRDSWMPASSEGAWNEGARKAHLCPPVWKKRIHYYFVCICLKGFQDENVITLKHDLDAKINIHKCSGSRWQSCGNFKGHQCKPFLLSHSIQPHCLCLNLMPLPFNKLPRNIKASRDTSVVFFF